MRVKLMILSVMLAMTLIPSAYAKSSNPANGGISGAFTITNMRQAGNNAIIDFGSSFVLTGTMSGTCVGVERDVVHSNENRTFFGRCDFNGTIDGRSGSALLRYEGSGSLAVFGGTTVVHGTTGNLVGLVLVASWEAHVTGPLSAVGTYSGHVHV